MNGITVVITTVQPRRRLLVRALQSVWNQTLQPNVVVIAQDTNRQGAAANRQAGTDAVATDLVAYLDDDDEMKPQHLQVLYDHLVKTDADLAYPWFDVVGGTDPFPYLEGQPWEKYRGQIPVTFLARVDSIRKAGGWSDEIREGESDPGTDPLGHRAGEDYRLVTRMHGMGMRLEHVPVRSWYWHHDSGNTSGLPSRVSWSGGWP